MSQTMSDDTFRMSLQYLRINDMLPLRQSDKIAKALVDDEIMRRHSRLFGPTDKAITSKIKDLSLAEIDAELRPFDPIFLRGASNYGLANLLGARIPPSSDTQLPQDGQQRETKVCMQQVRRVTPIFDMKVFQGLTRYRDLLIHRFPKYKEGILSGYYKYIRALDERWSDTVASPVPALLTSSEALKYLNMPTDTSLLQYVLSKCADPREGFKNAIIDRIARLQPFNEVPDAWEYGFSGDGTYEDADFRHSIRLRISQLLISPENKLTLQKYFRHRCQQIGLDPDGTFGPEWRAIIAEGNARDAAVLDYMNTHGIRTFAEAYRQLYG